MYLIDVSSGTKENIKARVKEGLCPKCGEWAYPYYLCQTHRITQNLNRVLRKFEKKGWVHVKLDSKGRKMFKWDNNADIGKLRNYTPESAAKMQLPRLNGRPMTDTIIQDAIIKVLEENGVPLSEKEIQKGIQQLKTISKVIPIKEDLIKEYNLIKEKRSTLSKNQRDAVHYRINFLLKTGAITDHDLTDSVCPFSTMIKNRD